MLGNYSPDLLLWTPLSVDLYRGTLGTLPPPWRFESFRKAPFLKCGSGDGPLGGFLRWSSAAPAVGR
jgi:hypothetical protein